MSIYSRMASTERRPLLGDNVSSLYNALDDGDDNASDTSTLAEIIYSPPLNNFSTIDTCWILAGLWSAVFLGALDGS